MQRDVVDWAARLGLHILNVGTTSTCVRPQGESIIDLTWSSPAASGWVTSWRVAEEMEILSDHLPIEVERRRAPRRRTAEGQRPRRWAVRKLDPDRLEASLEAALWAGGSQPRDIGEEALWLRRAMTAACDSAMPRATYTARRSAYWWTEEIAEQRRSSVRARRALQRARRRRGTTDAQLENLNEEYKELRASLRLAIRKAKERAWEEMILSLDEDPWGRPYRL
ncbi:PREDICTED: uncharacterized protein LOC105565438, partial [Vollenhovia emeryi]|uniref:uncharacterized protein LOC105565438 n=1 Tax=Vollenhovia emeryi TaxID=411798 RepID=UPI0005F3E028